MDFNSCQALLKISSIITGIWEEGVGGIENRPIPDTVTFEN